MGSQERCTEELTAPAGPLHPPSSLRSAWTSPGPAGRGCTLLPPPPDPGLPGTSSQYLCGEPEAGPPEVPPRLSCPLGWGPFGRPECEPQGLTALTVTVCQEARVAPVVTEAPDRRQVTPRKPPSVGNAPDVRCMYSPHRPTTPGSAQPTLKVLSTRLSLPSGDHRQEPILRPSAQRLMRFILYLSG